MTPHVIRSAALCEHGFQPALYAIGENYDPGGTVKHATPPALRRAHAAEADKADKPIRRARYSTPPRLMGMIAGCELTRRSRASACAFSIAAREIAGSSNAPTWIPQPPDCTIGATRVGGGAAAN